MSEGIFQNYKLVRDISNYSSAEKLNGLIYIKKKESRIN